MKNFHNFIRLSFMLIGLYVVISFTAYSQTPTIDGKIDTSATGEGYTFYKGIFSTDVQGYLYMNEDVDNFYFCWITSRGYNDNVYSNNKSEVEYAGWKKHDFAALRNSDHLVFILKKVGGTKVVDVDLDYLFLKNGTYYSGLGTGAQHYDGNDRIGGSYITENKTSLVYDIYQSGWGSWLTKSPQPEDQHPEWVYNIIYEFKVSKACLGGGSFLNADVPSSHNSPAKTTGWPEITMVGPGLICVGYPQYGDTDTWSYTFKIENVGVANLTNVLMKITWNFAYISGYDTYLDYNNSATWDGNSITPTTNNENLLVFDKFNNQSITIGPTLTKTLIVQFKLAPGLPQAAAGQEIKTTIAVSATNIWPETASLQDLQTCGALPVELVSFTASSVNQSVDLKWQTATEVNNYGFEIHRSIKGGIWVPIAFIQGHGTVNAPQSYSYRDENVGRSGTSFLYRLKQIDRDGGFEYSPTVEANFTVSKKDFGFISAYPNPFNPSTMLSFYVPEMMPVSLKVYDLRGKVISTILQEEQLQTGMHTYMFEASQLPSGTYYASLTSGGMKSVYRITLAR